LQVILERFEHFQGEERWKFNPSQIDQLLGIWCVFMSKDICENHGVACRADGTVSADQEAHSSVNLQDSRL
jgi:hypothetical protein